MTLSARRASFLRVLYLVLAFSVIAVFTVYHTERADASVADQAAQCVDSGGQWNQGEARCVQGQAAADSGPCGGGSVLGIPTWYKYLETDSIAGKCSPKIDSVEDILPVGLAVLEAALTLGGLVAVAMVFTGGFKYVVSQGEPDKAAGGRKTVMNALIGLSIIILATRVVSFIGNRLG